MSADSTPPAAADRWSTADFDRETPLPVPQAERQLLALHALRQRQLRNAFLHGRTRNWRDRRRIWPAVLVALVIIALLIAGTSVGLAFRRQQQLSSAERVTESVTTGWTLPARAQTGSPVIGRS